MPTRMHSVGACWIQKWVGQIENSGEIDKNYLDLLPENTLSGFEGDYEGYESYQELLHDADVLLEGSAGEIRRVILIKIEPLSRNASQIRGFVEVWKYDESTGRKKIVGERQVLFPPARQRSFAEDIFLLGRFVRGDEAGTSGWDTPKTGATKT
ncbi:hypothetical protein V8E54_003883 [Elaphomyces granulatus]